MGWVRPILAVMLALANDVRLASDLSDYTGMLEARMYLRITDKDNTPIPAGRVLPPPRT